MSTLIAGANSSYAQQLAHTLLDNGTDAASLILVTSDPSKVSDLEKAGCTIRKASLDDPQDALATAFAGAHTIFLPSTSTQQQHLEPTIDAAIAAGAKHIVYTSTISADREAPTALIAQSHNANESLLRSSNLAWTILRESSHMETLVDDFLPSAFDSGVLKSNAADGRVGFVSRGDCVEAAAAVLKNPSAHANVAYHITGQQALNLGEVASLAAGLGGKTVEFVAVGDEEMGKGEVGEEEGGRSSSSAEEIVSFGKAVRLGEWDVVSGDFEKLTGGLPTTITCVLKGKVEV